MNARFQYLHAQLVDDDAPAGLLQSIPILPDGITELWAFDDDFTNGDARLCLDGLDDDMYPGIEAKDKTCVGTV
jgi:hypothetical protein